MAGKGPLGQLPMNYRRGDWKGAHCGNCRFYGLLYCSMYQDAVTPGSVCNKWEGKK